MSVSESQLKEPITLSDAIDHQETLEGMALMMKDLFDRCRHQYQGDTWISNKLWEIHLLVGRAADEMSELRATRCFPDD